MWMYVICKWQYKYPAEEISSQDTLIAALETRLFHLFLLIKNWQTLHVRYYHKRESVSFQWLLCAQWQQGAGWFFGESVLFWFCQSCSDRRWMECRPWPRFMLSGDIAWFQKFIQVKIFFTNLSADLMLNRFGQIGAAPLRRRVNFSSNTFYSRCSR